MGHEGKFRLSFPKYAPKKETTTYRDGKKETDIETIFRGIFLKHPLTNLLMEKLLSIQTWRKNVW